MNQTQNKHLIECVDSRLTTFYHLHGEKTGHVQHHNQGGHNRDTGVWVVDPFSHQTCFVLVFSVLMMCSSQTEKLGEVNALCVGGGEIQEWETAEQYVHRQKLLNI